MKARNLIAIKVSIRSNNNTKTNNLIGTIPEIFQIFSQAEKLFLKFYGIYKRAVFKWNFLAVTIECSKGLEN